jgi:dipeptide/tripeptide permease
MVVGNGLEKMLLHYLWYQVYVFIHHVGGYFADKVIGFRWAVYCGASF